MSGQGVPVIDCADAPVVSPYTSHCPWFGNLQRVAPCACWGSWLEESIYLQVEMAIHQHVSHDNVPTAASVEQGWEMEDAQTFLSGVSPISGSRLWCNILNNLTNGMPDSSDVISYLACHWWDFSGHCIISWNLNLVKPDSGMTDARDCKLGGSPDTGLSPPSAGPLCWNSPRWCCHTLGGDR